MLDLSLGGAGGFGAVGAVGGSGPASDPWGGPVTNVPPPPPAQGAVANDPWAAKPSNISSDDAWGSPLNQPPQPPKNDPWGSSTTTPGR